MANTDKSKTGLIPVSAPLTPTGGDSPTQVGGVVAYSGDIYDPNELKNQEQINKANKEKFKKAVQDIKGDSEGISQGVILKHNTMNDESTYEEIKEYTGSVEQTLNLAKTSELGTLSSLKTTSKTSAVDALNEEYDKTQLHIKKVETIDAETGNLKDEEGNTYKPFMVDGVQATVTLAQGKDKDPHVFKVFSQNDDTTGNWVDKLNDEGRFTGVGTSLTVAGNAVTISSVGTNLIYVDGVEYTRYSAYDAQDSTKGITPTGSNAYYAYKSADGDVVYVLNDTTPTETSTAYLAGEGWGFSQSYPVTYESKGVQIKSTKEDGTTETDEAILATIEDLENVDADVVHISKDEVIKSNKVFKGLLRSEIEGLANTSTMSMACLDAGVNSLALYNPNNRANAGVCSTLIGYFIGNNATANYARYNTLIGSGNIASGSYDNIIGSLLYSMSITGDANATTYNLAYSIGTIMADVFTNAYVGVQLYSGELVEGKTKYVCAKVVSIDNTAKTITFDKTLDATNAVSGVIGFVNSAVATGDNLLGYGNVATGSYSTAIGDANLVAGVCDYTMGYFNRVKTSSYGMALGFGTYLSSNTNDSFILGSNCAAHHYFTQTFGNYLYNGSYRGTTIGFNAVNKGANSILMGICNGWGQMTLKGVQGGTTYIVTSSYGTDPNMLVGGVLGTSYRNAAIDPGANPDTPIAIIKTATKDDAGVTTITTDVALETTTGTEEKTYTRYISYSANLGTYSVVAGVAVNTGNASVVIGTDSGEGGHALNSANFGVVLGSAWNLGANGVAIGCQSTNKGENSIVIGNSITNSGAKSFVAGYNLTNTTESQTLIGSYNKATDSDFIVAHGTSSTPQNIIEHKDSKTYIKGVGNYDGTNRDETTTKSLQEVLSESVKVGVNVFTSSTEPTEAVDGDIWITTD